MPAITKPTVTHTTQKARNFIHNSNNNNNNHSNGNINSNNNKNGSKREDVTTNGQVTNDIVSPNRNKPDLLISQPDVHPVVAAPEKKLPDENSPEYTSKVMDVNIVQRLNK